MAAAPTAFQRGPISRLDGVLRGFYGRCVVFHGIRPAVGLCAPTRLSIFPPHRERSQENQFGIAIPWRGWTLSGPKVGGERTCSLTFASPSDPILLDRDRTRLAATLVILP